MQGQGILVTMSDALNVEVSQLKIHKLTLPFSLESDGKSRQSGAPEYKRLIAIHAGKPKAGLREALKAGLDSEKVRRLSLSEQALDKAAENYGLDVVRFTQKNFLRIYPKGTRIRSSNYQPLVGWMHGAQMVAFNMQKRSETNCQNALSKKIW